MSPIVIGGIALVAFLFLSRKASASSGGGSSGGAAGDPPLKALAPIGGDEASLPPLADVQPGASPQTAITSDALFRGFKGYVRIKWGDTLVALAAKACPMSGILTWQMIRDNPENKWCKDQTPTDQLSKYGLSLVQCYGFTVGTDCELVPGWRATRYKYNTGIYPVLRVG